MTDLEIYTRLSELAATDQQERKSDTLSFENDVARARELNSIVEQVGWPTISRFGEATCWDAWIIAQHCTMGLNPQSGKETDLSFQKHVMQLMRPLRRRNEVPARHYAYLLDRTRIIEGKLQPYGTQYKPTGDDGSAQLVDVWHPQSLDHRRAKIGMKPASLTFA